jgi:hypothetical protein
MVLWVRAVVWKSLRRVYVAERLDGEGMGMSALAPRPRCDRSLVEHAIGVKGVEAGGRPMVANGVTSHTVDWLIP